MNAKEKPLVWLHGEIKTPPFSSQGRIEAGVLLRRLQMGEKIALPHSRPMASVGARHELPIEDENKTWRLFYRIDPDAIVLLDIFEKKTQKTPKQVIENCKRRIRQYDS